MGKGRDLASSCLRGPPQLEGNGEMQEAARSRKPAPWGNCGEIAVQTLT